MKKHANEFDIKVNGHLIGITMKELVWRAITAIRSQQQVFEVTEKVGYSGKMDDMLTSADKAAQEIYIKSLRECFPTWGIIAEEDNLMVNCTDGSGYYFTVDPLDGTKAFVRRQSHGVGTMISLSRINGCKRKYIAAFVGDVNTQENYGFRPDSDTVHRITRHCSGEKLKAPNLPLKEQYVLLREPPEKYSYAAQRLIRGKFKNQLIDGSSIGTWMARLWKGEVGAVILPPSTETPWDSNPVTAISQKLGYVYLKPSESRASLKCFVWKQIEFEPIAKKYFRDHDLLIVHKNNLSEIPIL